jgi:hypothetical protein
MPGISSARAEMYQGGTILLLAQRAYRPGRIDPLKVGAQRLILNSRDFSNILTRFFSWARVEK